VKPHPARFPPQLPAFFISFLTEPSDVVLDPFAGSCTTGEVAENLGRFWIGIDRERDYLEGARYRFELPWDDDRRASILGEARAAGQSNRSSRASAEAAAGQRPAACFILVPDVRPAASDLSARSSAGVRFPRSELVSRPLGRDTPKSELTSALLAWLRRGGGAGSCGLDSLGTV
jgi:hypothetical protein